MSKIFGELLMLIEKDYRGTKAALAYSGTSFSVLKNLYIIGKLDIHGTIKNQIQKKKRLACEYDELSVNNIFNQILKTTVTILMKATSVKPERKADLKRVLLFFDEVEAISPAMIRWDMLRVQRNNRNYEMLMNICCFVLDGMIQTTGKGGYKMMALIPFRGHQAFLLLPHIIRHMVPSHPDVHVPLRCPEICSGFDGLVGYSPIAMAKNAVGMMKRLSLLIH